MKKLILLISFLFIGFLSIAQPSDFMVGTYQLFNIGSTIGPSLGTQNFEEAYVTISVGNSPNQRVFNGNLLPGLNAYSGEVVLDLSNNFIQLQQVDTGVGCSNSMVNIFYDSVSPVDASNWDVATGDSALYVRYTEDSQDSCGFGSSISSLFLFKVANPGETYIPDDNFEQTLINLGLDTVLDNVVVTANISTLVTLDLSSKGINNFTGIEDFTSLQDLNISNNSNFPNLLDLSALNNLERLNAENNNLSSIVLSDAIEELNLSENNLLTHDYSGYNNLKILELRNSTFTSELIFNTSIEELDLSSTNETTADFSTLSNLEKLNWSNSNLTTFPNVDTSIEELYLSNNFITENDYSSLVNLRILDLSNNGFNSSPIISDSVEILDVSGNNFARINLSSATSLTSINLNNNPSLFKVNLKNGSNSLISFLDATGLPNLICFEVNDASLMTSNFMTALDSGNQFSSDCSGLPEADFKLQVEMPYDINNSHAITTIRVSNSVPLTIDWGDGSPVETIPTGQLQPLGHNYPDDLTYVITIKGQMDAFTIWRGNGVQTDIEYNLLQWGFSEWQDVDYMFDGLYYLQITAIDIPDLSGITSTVGMFKECRDFNSDISNWDVSTVINMSVMFEYARNFNQSLDSWNVSNVTDMSSMFSRANRFNQNINNWDTSNVTNMDRMFFKAGSFNQPLNNWDVSQVTNMAYMFGCPDDAIVGYNGSSFNQNIESWNVSNVTNISGMFYNAQDFNQPLNNWDVSNVTDMSRVFGKDYSWSNQSQFNQPLDNWDTSSVTTMNRMFFNARSFNHSLASWDVSSVTDMEFMFLDAISFNQSLNNWNVSNVTTMSFMFHRATMFNQPLDTWDFSNVNDMDDMLSNSGVSTSNYDLFLSHLLSFPNLSLNLNSSGLTYCDSFSRNILIQNGWTISGDTLDPNCQTSDNLLQGSITFDLNNNGCDPNDIVVPNTGVSIDNGNVTGYIYSNSTGDYSIQIPDGSYTVTPIFDPNLFTIAPATATFTAANQNTTTQDFCLTATTPTDDLEITILPLEEARPGFDTDYKLVYKNKGNTQLSGNIVFTYDDDFMDFVSANPAVATSSVGNLNWGFSNLDPFETREIDFTINMNTPTDPSFPLNSNDILNFTASITPSANDATPLDNVFGLDQTVVNSYDPNDKTCLQGETIEPSRVGEYVHYRIRFENEGTASAINVRIVDYIDTSVFDISTFTPLSGSHDYVTQITEGNKVEFIFDNINLPNTAPASQGYVLFKIKTVSSLVLGDTISNQAEIYFDFNFPIITNLETTTVAMPLSNSDVTTMTMSLYPNPAHDSVTMTSNVQFDSYSIYDLRGVLISSYIMHQSDYQDQIDVSSLASGMYMIQVNSEQGSVTQRLIVN